MTVICFANSYGYTNYASVWNPSSTQLPELTVNVNMVQYLSVEIEGGATVYPNRWGAKGYTTVTVKDYYGRVVFSRTAGVTVWAKTVGINSSSEYWNNSGSSLYFTNGAKTVILTTSTDQHPEHNETAQAFGTVRW